MSGTVRGGLLIKNLVAKLAKRAGYTILRTETFNRLLVREAMLVSPQTTPSVVPISPLVPVSLGSPRDLPAPFAITMDQSFSADHFFQLGAAARGAGRAL